MTKADEETAWPTLGCNGSAHANAGISAVLGEDSGIGYYETNDVKKEEFIKVEIEKPKTAPANGSGQSGASGTSSSPSN